MTKDEMCVVTGATGRTGFPLCMELKKRGKRVRALYRKEGFITDKLRGIVDELAVCDVTDAAALDAALQGADTVFHLAGAVSIASKPGNTLKDANIGGTANVIDACLRQGVRRLVYTGTAHSIPFTDKKHLLTECGTFEPEKVHGAYAVSKSVASNLVLEAVRERGLDAVIALPTGIVGPYEYSGSNFGEMVAAVADGRLRIYVKGRYNFVDVRDVCTALCDLAEKGVKGESYIVSGEAITVKELMNDVAAAAGRKPVKVCVPMPLAKLFSYPAEKVSLKKRKTLMFTPYSMRVLCDNCNFSHEKLTALTGYAPRPVAESLADHTRFYFEEIKQR